MDFQEALGSQHGRVSVKAMSPEIRADAIAACRHVLTSHGDSLLRKLLELPRASRGSELDFSEILCGREMAKVTWTGWRSHPKPSKARS